MIKTIAANNSFYGEKKYQPRDDRYRPKGEGEQRSENRFQNRDNLIKMAIACEKFDLKKRNVEQTLGGLHDYIWRLEDPDIIKIIFDYAAQYSELNSLAKLKELAEIVEPKEAVNVNDYLNYGTIN